MGSLEVVGVDLGVGELGEVGGRLRPLANELGGGLGVLPLFDL
jgi:hypothetical protein